MRVRQGVMIALSVSCGLALIAGNAAANTIGDPNLFSGHTVATSSVYGGMPQFVGSNLTDGATSVHIFNDGNAWNHTAIMGFDSNISTLRFYDAGWGPRSPESVMVYYSTDPNPTSMAPFTYYGTYSLTTQPVTGGTGYTNPSSNPGDIVGPNALPANYAQVNGLNIPYGTQSIWFSFPGVTGANYGPALSEIQGFAPAVGDVNLLLGKPVSASSSYGGPFSPSFATDGTGNQHVFQDPAADQRLVISQIGSGFDTIRLWRDPESPRVPARALIKSSTENLSAYDDALWASQAPLIDLSTIEFNAAGYADISVNAPVGTESLFFDFGAGDSNGASYGVRVVEVQAFSFGTAVPEPSALALCAGGLFGLLAYAWRRRK